MPDDPKDTKPVEDPKPDVKPDVTPEPTPDPREEKLSNLEKKIGEMSASLKEKDDYTKIFGTVVETLNSDPTLKAAFQRKYGELYMGQQPSQNPAPTDPNGGKQPQNPPSDPRVNEVVASQRENIILDFEKAYGINSLPAEERKSVQREIANYLGGFGTSVETSPLTTLRSNLEKAYVGVRAEKLKEEGKLEGFAQARANSNGVIGTFSGGAPNPDQKEVLNDKQAEWAKKMGLDPEKVKETIKKQK